MWLELFMEFCKIMGLTAAAAAAGAALVLTFFHVVRTL